DLLEGTAALPGNPRGLRLETFGAAVAAAATEAPELDFMNRVHHLWPEDASHLPAILRFYSGTGIRPWFEVFPTEDGADAVAGAIARAGAAPVSYATFLYGVAVEPPAVRGEGIDIRNLSHEDVDAFSDALLRGHGVPDDELGLAGAAQRHWPGLPGT